MADIIYIDDILFLIFSDNDMQEFFSRIAKKLYDIDLY